MLFAVMLQEQQTLRQPSMPQLVDVAQPPIYMPRRNVSWHLIPAQSIYFHSQTDQHRHFPPSSFGIHVMYPPSSHTVHISWLPLVCSLQNLHWCYDIYSSTALTFVPVTRLDANNTMH